MKRLPLKCHSFRYRSSFTRIWFWDLRFRTWGLEINHLNAHIFMWQGLFFFPTHISQLERPIELKFAQVCYFMQCLDTPNEKTGLWQLPIVSTAFNCLQTFVYWVTKHIYTWIILLNCTLWTKIGLATTLFTTRINEMKWMKWPM